MAIYTGDGLFRLDTERSSYWFRISKFGHPEHIYYGPKLAEGDPENLAVKRTMPRGTNVAYSAEDESYSLDTMCLEWSGIGRGDYRMSPCEMKMPDGSYACDAVYVSHEIVEGCVAMECLPGAYADADTKGVETLILTLRDSSNPVELVLFYTVFPETDVISRRCLVKNSGDSEISIRRIMSMSLDLPEDSYNMHTFDGGWIKEAHHTVRSVEYGIYVNSSTTGNSSNRHNPGFLLSRKSTGEEQGACWGFNLVYSGNHYGAVERAGDGLVRVQLGINPHCFDWTLKAGESFETPEAVMSFASDGFNGLRRNFHAFVNSSIVRGDWKNIARPVLLNNWEAHFFKFTHGKLVRLARRAKALGVELFVLDDGWFGSRNNDRAGLGDYDVNVRKLPHGLTGLANKIRAMGMDFGLWFEPEMVNPDSELYRAHPEWALTTPGKEPCMGRNQLVLDLSRAEVRDHIVENVGRIIDETGLKYVKWDMNRHISDAFSPALENQGEFYHRYILGLYDVLERIFRPRPHVLLESCASGGNRFDLGMLCYSPQIWASDNTDPIERLSIQGGLSYLYPQSCWGSHVSAAPHQQTLRDTQLSTRFNVAAFGCLGYELDLRWLSRAEKREIRSQIEFYKAHRMSFQYGQFMRHEAIKANKEHWQVLAKNGESICGFYQKLGETAESGDRLPVAGLEPEREYSVSARRQSVFIGRLAGLVKHVMPFELNPKGFILRTADKIYTMTDGSEDYSARGDMIMAGLALEDQFIGSGYSPRLRLMGDYGSNLYIISPKETKNESI